MKNNQQLKITWEPSSDLHQPINSWKKLKSVYKKPVAKDHNHLNLLSCIDPREKNKNTQTVIDLTISETKSVPSDSEPDCTLPKLPKNKKPPSLLDFKNNNYVYVVSKPYIDNNGHKLREKAIVKTTKKPFKVSLLICEKCPILFEFSYDLSTLPRALEEASVPPCGRQVEGNKVYRKPGIIEERRKFDIERPDWWDSGCEVTDSDYIEVMKYLCDYCDEDIKNLDMYDERKSLKAWEEEGGF
jgi:hypothetical protein